MILVEASVWKRRLHLPGKDKEAARQKALQLFPSQHALLARKKDHGRAEAALIVVASLGAHAMKRLPRDQQKKLADRRPAREGMAPMARRGISRGAQRCRMAQSIAELMTLLDRLDIEFCRRTARLFRAHRLELPLATTCA